MVAPSNGFNRIGGSESRTYGPEFGAGVVLPKHLLTAAMSGTTTDYDHLLRDNYETPLYTPQLRGGEVELQQLESILKLSVDDFRTHAKMLSSPDELSMYIARQLMQQESPRLLWITMHDIDIAHAGAYSLYIEGIQRTDRLCVELWKTVQSNPEYAGNTTLFILPDFGRDADEDSGGNGFQHHRTGDVASRTTWMMALGAGRPRGRGLRTVPYNRSTLFPPWVRCWASPHLSRKASPFRSCCSSCFHAISKSSSSMGILPKRRSCSASTS